MPVLSLACHLPHNTPNIPSRYNNEQTTKQTKAINNSYIYIYISHVNVTQTVPDISPLMPMHQDPLLVHPLSTLQPLLPYVPYIHYNDVIMGAIASQITSLTNGYYSTVYSGADQRKHQSPASLAFVRGIHRWPVNSPHKWPVTRKMFPFDDVIMYWESFHDLFHWVGSILFGYPICFTKSW